MNKITTTVFLFISALTVVAIGYIARDVYVLYQTLLEAQNTPETPLLQQELEVSMAPVQYVTASWYDYYLPEYPFYSRDYDTCASRDYPKGTKLRVSTATGRSIVCRVNDYIEHPDRQIDLSSHAFIALAPLSQGLVQVTIEEV